METVGDGKSRTAFNSILNVLQRRASNELTKTVMVRVGRLAGISVPFVLARVHKLVFVLRTGKMQVQSSNFALQEQDHGEMVRACCAAADIIGLDIYTSQHVFQ